MLERRLTVLLLALDFLLVCAHGVGIVVRGEPFVMLNLDGEANIPAWWSNAKFVMAGTLFAIVALGRHRRALAPWLLCALFFALAADEIASVHEKIGRVLADNVAGDVQFKRKDAFLWPLLFGLPVIGVGAAVLYKLAQERSLSLNVWRRLALALAVFFVGAVGVEIVAFNPFLPIVQGSPLYQWLAVLEEGLEHAGASLLVWAALTAFVERFPHTGESPTPVP